MGEVIGKNQHCPKHGLYVGASCYACVSHHNKPGPVPEVATGSACIVMLGTDLGAGVPDTPNPQSDGPIRLPVSIRDGIRLDGTKYSMLLDGDGAALFEALRSERPVLEQIARAINYHERLLKVLRDADLYGFEHLHDCGQSEPCPCGADASWERAEGLRAELKKESGSGE